MEAVSPECIENAPRLRRRVGDLPASAWLDLWERGQDQTSARRGLIWLEAARLEDQDDPASWTIAERDAQILFLRESAFGLEMEGSAHCPRCGEWLELQFTTREVLPRVEMPVGRIEVELDGCTARFRLPVVGDLADLSAFAPDAARDELLAVCFLEGQRAGIGIAFREVPESVRAAVEEEMARRDPYAHTELALDCPACGQAWNEPFDAASFLGAELEAWARRTLNEVHLMASAYGWTESQILQLSPTRRQLYLGLLGT